MLASKCFLPSHILHNDKCNVNSVDVIRSVHIESLYSETTMIVFVHFYIHLNNIWILVFEKGLFQFKMYQNISLNEEKCLSH